MMSTTISITEGVRKILEHYPNAGRDSLIPILQEMNAEWESKMGLDSLSPEFMSELSELTFKSIEINEE